MVNKLREQCVPGGGMMEQLYLDVKGRTNQ